MIDTCKRDDNGWRIPHVGTKSRQIYDLLVQGVTDHAKIIALTGSRRGAVRTLIWKIKHPDTANDVQAAARRRRTIRGHAT